MDLSGFRTDVEKENKGIWVDIPGGLRVKIARMHNEGMVKAYAKYPAAIRNNLDNMKLDEKTSANIMAGLLAEHVLLGWEGLDEDGSALPYTIENAKRILADPEYKDFRALIVNLASTQELFHKEAVMEKAKNSKSG